MTLSGIVTAVRTGMSDNSAGLAKCIPSERRCNLTLPMLGTFATIWHVSFAKAGGGPK